jgi:hypothetical protein
VSWDAYLTDDRGHSDGEWNYTHNCNGMPARVFEDAGYELPWDSRPCYALPIDPATGCLTYYPNGRHVVSWWDHLDGMSGPEGAAFLDIIIRGLEADPGRFRAMNPTNGWGDYDSFLKVLQEMRAAVPEWPTAWSVHG